MVISEAEVPVPVLAEVVLVELWGELSQVVLCGTAGERRWRVTDVVGAEDGLGVECLSGSGAIASAYARAFRDGFTLTLVSGRTVGIGAYLARLGRRCAATSCFSRADVRPWQGSPLLPA